MIFQGICHADDRPWFLDPDVVVLEPEMDDLDGFYPALFFHAQSGIKAIVKRPLSNLFAILTFLRSVGVIVCNNIQFYE
jgi:hypothetical protein